MKQKLKITMTLEEAEALREAGAAGLTYTDPKRRTAAERALRKVAMEAEGMKSELALTCDHCGRATIIADRKLEDTVGDHAPDCAWALRLVGKPPAAGTA